MDFQQFKLLHPVYSPSRTAAMNGMLLSRFYIHHPFAIKIHVERGMPNWLEPFQRLWRLINACLRAYELRCDSTERGGQVIIDLLFGLNL